MPVPSRTAIAASVPQPKRRAIVPAELTSRSETRGNRADVSLAPGGKPAERGGVSPHPAMSGRADRSGTRRPQPRTESAHALSPRRPDRCGGLPSLGG
jgi:hypothetical protein